MNGCIPRVRENSGRRSPYSDGGRVENKRGALARKSRVIVRVIPVLPLLAACRVSSVSLSLFASRATSAFSSLALPLLTLSLSPNDLLSFSSYRVLYSTARESLAHLSLFVCAYSPSRSRFVRFPSVHFSAKAV